MSNAIRQIGVVVALGTFLGCNALIGLELGEPEKGGITGGGNGGEGGSMVTPECTPSMAVGPVADKCGVFVSSSKGKEKPEGNGSQGKPFLKFADGIALAADAHTPVYACAEDFAEAVVVLPGVVIFGGLDCATNWHYVGDTTKTRIAPDPGAVPITLQSGPGKTTIEDVTAEAADANPAIYGASSIAVIAQEGSEVELNGCNLIAGTGAPGAPGITPDTPVMVGANGEDGAAGCVGPMSTSGGPGGITQCGDVETSGGIGGEGTASTQGFPGLEGEPPSGPASEDGKGGKGFDSMSACENGKDGHGGDNGPRGPGGQGVGTIADAGYSGAPGMDGTAGKPGQGGGGGGGTKECTGGINAGPAGGGGGAGGCGGAPGKGGSAGGSSIGLLSHKATVSLLNTNMTTSKGGEGGNGGDSQSGGFGGIAGNPGANNGGGVNACKGGDGGQGGTGGLGGGGLGGHSIAVAFLGTEPKTVGGTITPGMRGSGGLAADQDVTGKGGDGQSCSRLNFSESAACD